MSNKTEEGGRGKKLPTEKMFMIIETIFFKYISKVGPTLENIEYVKFQYHDNIVPLKPEK